MHPIERLRFVARADGVPGDVLACEAAGALVSFANDPAAMVAACRRVLARQVSCGPLWWVCAGLLTSDDVRACARECITMLESDTTGAATALAVDLIEAGGARPQLIRALAVGDGSAVVPADQAARLSGAGQRWLVGGIGVRLSDPMWSSLVEHFSTMPRRGEELVSLDRFTHLVGPDGPVPIGSLGAPDCPVAPELFRLVG